MDKYEESHAFFLQELAPHHKEVIRKLTNLRNGIQANVKFQKEISNMFSLDGILGGCILLGGLFLSPVTGGGSFVAAVGSAYGMASGGLDVVNGIISTSKINQNLNEAQECLENHEEVLKKMYNSLEKLHYYIKQVARSIEIIEQRVSENNTTYEKSLRLAGQIGGIALNAKGFNVQTILSQGSGVYQLLKLREPLGKIMPTALQQTANEVTTQLVKAAAEGAAKGAKAAVEGATKEAGKGAAKEAGKAAAKGAAKGASRGALKKIANEGSRRIARQSASKVAEETVTTSAKVMGTVAVIGIILDLKTIYSNLNDLSKMEKGKFCDQAKCLDNAIKDLEDEFDRIHNVFKVPISLI